MVEAGMVGTEVGVAVSVGDEGSGSVGNNVVVGDTRVGVLVTGWHATSRSRQGIANLRANMN